MKFRMRRSNIYLMYTLENRLERMGKNEDKKGERIRKHKKV